MCKKLQLLGNQFPKPSAVAVAPGPQWGTSGTPAFLAALSVNEYICSSLYGCVLVTTSVARQTSGRPPAWFWQVLTKSRMRTGATNSASNWTDFSVVNGLAISNLISLHD